MTTPTQLREAAERFDVFFRRNENESRDLDESQIPTDEDYLLAANTLRAIASAQNDADESYKTWLDANICHKVGSLSWLPREAYLAGHAQGYAAGLAASPSDVSEHLQEMWRKSVCFLRDQLEAKKRALAASSAKCAELGAERPKRLCDYDPVEATIGDMVTNFGFDYTNFKFLAEGITKYNDALATAKADALTKEARIDELEGAIEIWRCLNDTKTAELKTTDDSGRKLMEELYTVKNAYESQADELTDAYKRNEEIKADALEMANEVRRCRNIAKGGAYSDWCDSCNDIIEQSPAAVTAAMEKYVNTPGPSAGCP